MAATTFDLDIWIDDQDQPMKVRADARDMAAYEAEHNRSSLGDFVERPVTFFRFIGTHAAKRKGLVKAEDFKAWCDTVIDVDPAEEEEAADPGQPAASDAPSSS